MALVTANFNKVDSGMFATSPARYSYLSADTVVATTASAYFNNVSSILRKFDRIEIEASDGRGVYYVSSTTASTPVTVATVGAAVTAGSIVNADISGTAGITVGKVALATGSMILGTAGVGAALDVSTDKGIIIGNATTATVAALTGDVTMSNLGVTAIGAGKVTNAMVSPAALDGTVAKVVANINVIGGIPQIFRILTVAGGTASIDVTVTHKIRVIDAWIVCKGTGTASDTITILSTASAITNAIDGNVADKVVVRAGTIDDANQEIAAGGILRVTATDGGGADIPAYEVYVHAIRVA